MTCRILRCRNGESEIAMIKNKSQVTQITYRNSDGVLVKYFPTPFQALEFVKAAKANGFLSEFIAMEQVSIRTYAKYLGLAQ